MRQHQPRRKIGRLALVSATAAERNDMTTLFLPKSILDSGLEGAVEKDAAYVPQALWRDWIENQSTEVLLIELKQRETVHVLSVEGPHQDGDDIVYIPSRLLMDFDTSEYCIAKQLEEMPPTVTKLVLQPLDNELYHCDIAGAVSAHLATWNVLRKHMTLTVPCEELGGFQVDIFIKECEPADVVLLRGEVPIELAESLETVQEWTRAPTPPPAPPATLLPSAEAEDFNTLVPIQMPSRGGFVPFSGTGNRLGGGKP